MSFHAYDLLRFYRACAHCDAPVFALARQSMGGADYGIRSVFGDGCARGLVFENAMDFLPRLRGKRFGKRNRVEQLFRVVGGSALAVAVRGGVGDFRRLLCGILFFDPFAVCARVFLALYASLSSPSACRGNRRGLSFVGCGFLARAVFPHPPYGVFGRVGRIRKKFAYPDKIRRVRFLRGVACDFDRRVFLYRRFFVGRRRFGFGRVRRIFFAQSTQPVRI